MCVFVYIHAYNCPSAVRINISSIIKKIGVNNVKVKGEQWVQCDACSKWSDINI